MADLPNRSPAGSEAGSLYEGSSGKGPTPLAELSKEDLIQRCKKLLQIAQKAKAAKDGKTPRKTFISFLMLSQRENFLWCLSTFVGSHDL